MPQSHVMCSCCLCGSWLKFDQKLPGISISISLTILTFLWLMYMYFIRITKRDFKLPKTHEGIQRVMLHNYDPEHGLVFAR